ncbi:MAG: sigma-54-dependent Fis family transcriptional regulator [Candidatus Marinimicrobia bacterium]|nr:sigma-54-dependent Fis family transcriptional regulator [Candidatus Neomarinimicrobiota bacterium]
MTRILIADDERELRNSLYTVLSEEGFECNTAADGEEAIKLIEKENFDILIVDIKMPKKNGMEVLETTNRISPKTLTIIITAYATVETAIEALRRGAVDYLIKPVDFDEVIMRVKRIKQYQQLNLEVQYLRKEIHSKFNENIIIGKSPAIQNVFQLIKKVANSNSNILITGKSGTGKELVARAIHQASPRANAPFIPINCGAIPENLFESELFGFKKGSFTGATMDKDGVFRAANGGTLFLDEVGEIPIHIQVKLLRAIESKEIKPLGSNTTLKVDVRVLSATNKDLKKEIEEGNFREDLYYRLNIIEIHLPSLNERREDIPLLIEHFIRKYNHELKRKVRGVDNETMKVLMNYNYKGEVRELENMIERAVLLCEGDYITLKDLPPHTASQVHEGYPDELKSAVRQFERQHILAIMRRTGNDKVKASKILGIGLSSLYRKIDELGIEV